MLYYIRDPISFRRVRYISKRCGSVFDKICSNTVEPRGDLSCFIQKYPSTVLECSYDNIQDIKVVGLITKYKPKIHLSIFQSSKLTNVGFLQTVGGCVKEIVCLSSQQQVLRTLRYFTEASKITFNVLVFPQISHTLHNLRTLNTLNVVCCLSHASLKVLQSIFDDPIKDFRGTFQLGGAVDGECLQHLMSNAAVKEKRFTVVVKDPEMTNEILTAVQSGLVLSRE